MTGAVSLESVLAAWGVGKDTALVGALREYLRLLSTWNQRINLTGAGSVDELVGEHLPDSLAMLGLVPAGARLLDVGSGGGLPAVPFAIARPDVRVTLLEPRAKRVAFLRTAARQLRLPNVQVRAGRLEPPLGVPSDRSSPGAVASGERGSLAAASVSADEERFDVLASRATFPPPVWLAVAVPHLAPGGRVLVFASRPEPTPPPADRRLVKEVRYETASHHSRWLGAYCST